ncbi:MAG: SDR family oxidoreductase [Bryobacterales bacterium]|nr:SDR family oxidoreductase [Bryobacterales bacterium]
MTVDATAIYRSNEILITGANGFVGKVTLGLLLERFSDFKRLHILMRAKRGYSPRERFERDVLTSPSLKPVMEKLDPAIIRDRVTMHTGDLAEPFCGFDQGTIAELRGRVPLIINVAGLVEFTPPVDESFKSNVDGAENVIALAKALGAKLVHVSTCFVCGKSDGLVEEDEPIPGFYPNSKGPTDDSFRARDEVAFMRARIAEVYEAAKAAAARGRDVSKETRQKLADLGVQRAAQWGWVNTYTYSKSIGEQLIATEPDLDYTIVRPAIVEAALEFPFPGWVEGGRTAAPLIMMAMSGLRHWPLRADAPMEVVPVDQVATAILTAGALLLEGQAQPVYHLGTADRNPVPLGKIVDWMFDDFCKLKKRPRALMPGVRLLTPEKARRRGQKLLDRLHMAQSAAAGLRNFTQRTGLPGKAAFGRAASMLRMLGLQVTIREQALELYRPFIHDNRFIFESANIRHANSLLRAEDRAKLPWTPEKIDWHHYWSEHEVKGIQKWVEAETTKGWSFKI